MNYLNIPFPRLKSPNIRLVSADDNIEFDSANGWDALISNINDTGTFIFTINKSYKASTHLVQTGTDADCCDCEDNDCCDCGSGDCCDCGSGDCCDCGSGDCCDCGSSATRLPPLSGKTVNTMPFRSYGLYDAYKSHFLLDQYNHKLCQLEIDEDKLSTSRATNETTYIRLSEWNDNLNGCANVNYPDQFEYVFKLPYKANLSALYEKMNYMCFYLGDFAGNNRTWEPILELGYNEMDGTCLYRCDFSATGSYWNEHAVQSEYRHKYASGTYGTVWNFPKEILEPWINGWTDLCFRIVSCRTNQHTDYDGDSIWVTSNFAKKIPYEIGLDVEFWFSTFKVEN